LRLKSHAQGKSRLPSPDRMTALISHSMSNEIQQSNFSHIQDVISRLQSPIQKLETLFEALAAPLATLNILPPRFLKHNTRPLPQQGISVAKHVPPLQRAIIESVLPAWEHLLDEQDAYILVLQYFAPDTFSFGRAAAKDIALYAYTTILSLPLTQQSVRLLVHLCKAYPIDILWSVSVSDKSTPSSRHAITWEDCVRNVCAVPAKVANALGPRGAIPEELQYGPYFNYTSQRFQLLIDLLATKPSSQSTDSFSINTLSSLTRCLVGELASLGYLLNKLVNIGVFPATKPTSPSQPSFFDTILPSIRERLEPSSEHPSAWPRVLGSISSITTLQAILASLLSHLTPIPDMDGTPEARALVKREAVVLSVFVGPVTEDSEILDDLAASALGRNWSVGHARILSCFAAGCGAATSDTTGEQFNGA
jgi:telomere length regulation protein